MKENIYEIPPDLSNYLPGCSCHLNIFKPLKQPIPNPSELLRLIACIVGILSSLSPPGYAESDTLPPFLAAWPRPVFDALDGVNVSAPSLSYKVVISCITSNQVAVASFLVVQRASGRPLSYIKPFPCNVLLTLA